MLGTRSHLARTAAAAAWLVLAAGALATPEEARQRFERAAAAIGELRSLSYTVQSRGEGAFFGSLTPKTECRVLMVRQAPAEGAEGPGPWLIRTSGQADVPNQGAQAFVVVSDGTHREWIDNAKSAVYRKPAGQARGEAIDLAGSSTFQEMSDAAPFAKQLASTEMRLDGTAEVAGVPCEVVFVELGERMEKQRWSFATTDGLPRRLERIFQHDSFDESQVYEITQLTVNPDLRPEMFAITVPEGFQDLRTPARAPTPAAALGPAASASPAPAGGSTGAPARTVGTESGDLAQDFELATPEGAKVKLSDLRGGVVVLDFWGTWCPPCREASPKLQEIHDRFADRGVRVLGLAVRERSDAAPVDYFKKTGLTYTLLLRADGVARAYRIRAFPTFVVIGRRGEILHRAEGVAADTFAEIARVIDEQLSAAEREGE